VPARRRARWRRGPEEDAPAWPPIGDLGLTVVGSVLAARARACPVAAAISYAAPGIRGSGGSSASGGGTNLLPGAGLPWRWRGLHRTTAAGSLSPSCIGPLDLAWRALPRQQCRLHHGDLPPTLHHGGGLCISLVFRSARSRANPTQRSPRSSGSDNSGLDWARQWS
jgi:hypothetical protein